jgi:hypothetical protein
MLKIKITGAKAEERAALQRCLTRFLHHNDVRAVESVKDGSTVKQVITTPNPSEALPTTLTLIECDNTTPICRTDLRLVASAIGETEADVEAQTHRSWYVTVKVPGRGDHNRVVAAADPNDAVRKLKIKEPFEHIIVRPC